jgi:hypothetical protein
MKAKTLIWIASSFVISSGFVVILFLTSFDFSRQKNDFVRLFAPRPLMPEDTVDLKYNSYYVAGSSGHNIYLANYTALLHLLAVNTMKGDTQHITLSLKLPKGMQLTTGTRIKLDSPYFFVMDGVAPLLLRGQISEWTAERFMYDSAYFTTAVPINPSSLIVRTTSRLTREQTLGKESATAPHISLKPELLEKQIDGIFCTDGMMHYSRELGRLVYLYFYRNQFIVTDSSLNLIYKAHTIDTNRVVKIKTSVDHKSKSQLASPPYTINLSSSVSGNYMFVNSNLLSKNEMPNALEANSVIDVYDLKDGLYQFSFYIPAYLGNRLKTFEVFDRKLIALYEQHVIIYSINSIYVLNK